MATEVVKIGALYEHDEMGTRMRCESASVPSLDDNVTLVEPSKYTHTNTFVVTWRGTWSTFLQEWTRVKE